MAYREELKYVHDPSVTAELLHRVIKLGAEEIFRPRIVNSVYFDTSDRTLFIQSEEGVRPRRKVRVRWYDDDLSNAKEFFIEKKISSEFGRFKSSNLIEVERAQEFLNKGIFEPSYGLLQKSLYVKYRRRYFKLGNDRITLDTSIKYKKKPTSTMFFEDTMNVMELKVTKYTKSKTYLDSLVSQSRFSKYCRGITRTEDWRV